MAVMQLTMSQWTKKVEMAVTNGQVLMIDAIG